MKNTGRPQKYIFRLTALAAVFTAILLMTFTSVSAATINADDITIRNTAEDKSDYSNSIGVLQQGDRVKVLFWTTDSSGNEWYYVELENGNRGYVKAQWVDLGVEEAVEEESAARENGVPVIDDEDTAGREEDADREEAAGQEGGAAEDEAVPDDDGRTRDDQEQSAGTPAADDETAGSVSDEDEASDTQDASHVGNGQENDPYTDPNAKYGINFATEEDGTGHWYIYNYDTDKRIRIGDLEKLSDAEAAAQKNAAAAGMWRAIACILIVTQILTIILLLVLIRSLSSALKKQNKPQITGRTNPKEHRRQGSLAPQDDPAGNLTITRDEDLDL